jgi:DNA-binding CsgD family transcriptional regulator
MVRGAGQGGVVIRKKAGADEKQYQREQGAVNKDIGAEGRPLTGREAETLKYLSQGMTREEIAAQMGISRNGVNKHLASIYYKLGANKSADAVQIANLKGIL